VLAALLLGAAITALFVARELRVREPLFDVRILRRPVAAAGAATLFVSYFVFTGMLFVFPQWLEGVQDESIVVVGLLLVPFAAVFGVASLRAAAVLQRFGARATVSVGLALCGAGLAAIALFQDTSVAATIVATAVVGVGLSGLIAPASTVVMNDVPAAKAGDASSLNMVSRFVGAAVGVAAVGSLLSSVYRDRIRSATAPLTGPQAAVARGSLQGALRTAASLPHAAGSRLIVAARDAFTAGGRVGYLLVAVLAAGAALWAWRALRPRAPTLVAPGTAGTRREAAATG
jgi:MFS family permease